MLSADPPVIWGVTVTPAMDLEITVAIPLPSGKNTPPFPAVAKARTRGAVSARANRGAMALPNEAPIPRSLIASLRVIFVIACSSRANLDLTAEYIFSNTHFSNRKIAGFENRVLSVCFHEAPHRLENFFRMVTMRRVAALGQEQYFDRGGDLSLHRLHLFHRSV